MSCRNCVLDSPWIRVPLGLALVALIALPAAAERGWPDFRGPSQDGHVAAPGDTTPVGLPLQWSESEHVTWKTPIPLKGWSTPVVLEGKIWLTTATEDGHNFYGIAVDAATGKVLYNEKLFHSDNPEPLGNGVNCYASPSPDVEPGRVYLNFGSYGTACLDTTNFKILWQRQDLPCRHYRGPGSSPILWNDLLILTFDGADHQYVTALNKLTGESVWKTDRTTTWKDFDDQGVVISEGDLRKGFSTPIVVDAAGTPMLLSPGSSASFAYDARTGKEIWSLPRVGHTPAPRPVYANGIAYLFNGRGPTDLLAVRVDGTGDVSATHVAWKQEGGTLPQEPSPILVDGLFYMISNSGVVSCLDAATGDVIWSERIGGNYVTSPIHADGRLYFTSTQGKTHVLRAGRSFESLAINELDEGCMASPAVTGKAIILRTKTHLYRIED